jgi:hypothetical protein
VRRALLHEADWIVDSFNELSELEIVKGLLG